MKRDFLKSLGIEDKDIIDQILDENSADIGRAKSNTDELKSQITQLQTQLNDKTNEFNALKESTKDYENLQNQIAQLTTDKTTLQNELNNQVTQLKQEHERENKVRDAKAKNVKAVMALLDPNKDTDEQLAALKAGEDTAFLFGETHSGSPSGTQPNNPPSGGHGGTPPTGKSFVEAIAAQLTSNK